MAKGLKISDWVVSRVDGSRGYILSNEGNGFWEIQFTYPVYFKDIARSNKLEKLDFELNSDQIESLKELAKNLALDTRDFKWLENINKGNPLSSDI